MFDSCTVSKMDPVTAVKVYFGIALMVWCHRCASVSHDVSHYMEDICGHTVSFSSEEANEFLFSLSKDESSFAANMYCRVVIEADPGFQIMFKFTRLDFSSSSHYLSLYSSAISGRYGIDTYINDLSYTYVSITPSNKGILLFRSGSIGLSGGMSVIVTMFKQANLFTVFDPKCDTGYFLCQNNRCISEDLECNTRDNCGDESDETEDCDLGWWIFVVIVIIVIFTVLAITICVCKLCKKKKMPSIAVDQRQQISTIRSGLYYQSGHTEASRAINSLEMNVSQATQHGSMQMGTTQPTQHSWMPMGVSSPMPYYQPGMSSPYNNQQMNPPQVPPHSPMQMGASYPGPHAPMPIPVSPPGFIPHNPSNDPPAYSSLAMNPSAPPLQLIKEEKPGPLPK